MTTLITVLIVLAAIALILVVLVQKSKGGGLSSGFSSSNSIMGVRKTTDFVEKATWGLAGFIIVMSIAVVVISPKNVGTQSLIAPPPVMPSSTTSPDMSTETEIPGLTTPAPAVEQPKAEETAE